MARKHLEAADVAFLVIDAVEVSLRLTPPSEATPTRAALDHHCGEQMGPGSQADRTIYSSRCAAPSSFWITLPLSLSQLRGRRTWRSSSKRSIWSVRTSQTIGTSQMNRFIESVDFERVLCPTGKK